MPIILMAVLFGLAMDYEVFLVSGMREAVRARSGMPGARSRVGFANGARVVTAAALIMFFVFFAFVPEGGGTIKAHRARPRGRHRVRRVPRAHDARARAHDPVRQGARGGCRSGSAASCRTSTSRASSCASTRTPSRGPRASATSRSAPTTSSPDAPSRNPRASRGRAPGRADLAQHSDRRARRRRG